MTKKLKLEKTGKLKKFGEIIKVSLLLIINFLFIGITDLIWAPDSLHFASCGTDSRICIMNINEN